MLSYLFMNRTREVRSFKPSQRRVMLSKGSEFLVEETYSPDGGLLRQGVEIFEPGLSVETMESPSRWRG